MGGDGQNHLLQIGPDGESQLIQVLGSGGDDGIVTVAPSALLSDQVGREALS